jgi:hypothetical protein
MGLNAAIFGGNWDETTNSGSRCSNWNNSPTNSNNNIGARGVCEDMTFASALCRRYGAAGRPLSMWSAMLSCFGKHLWGFRKATSSRRMLRAKVASGLLVEACRG